MVEPFSWPMTQMLSPRKRPKPPTMRLVLAELAVAGERRELGDQRVDVVEAMRPLRMARHLRLLPRRQVGVEVAQRLRRLGLEPRDLVADVGCRSAASARSSSTLASSSATGFSKSR